jgi:hypothetical protein
MPKFRVHYNETYFYRYDIEAADEDAAADEARLLAGNILTPEDSTGEVAQIDPLDAAAEVDFTAPIKW